MSSTAALMLSSGMAVATTISVDFDSGTLGSGIYEESGFTFSSDNPGGAGLANNCPTGSPNSSCLQFNNNEIITVTYLGGLAFDVLGFLFNAPGNGGDIFVTDGTQSETLTETNNGNTMSPAVLTNTYTGIFSFSFQNVANGTGRVDNITFGVSDPAPVPLPASGLLLLGGLGAMAMRGRRKAG